MLGEGGPLSDRSLCPGAGGSCVNLHATRHECGSLVLGRHDRGHTKGAHKNNERRGHIAAAAVRFLGRACVERAFITLADAQLLVACLAQLRGVGRERGVRLAVDVCERRALRVALRELRREWESRCRCAGGRRATSAPDGGSPRPWAMLVIRDAARGRACSGGSRVLCASARRACGISGSGSLRRF
jgi:hypothetical protein